LLVLQGLPGELTSQLENLQAKLAPSSI